jgi:transposase
MKPTSEFLNINAEEFEALIERVNHSSLLETDRTLLVTVLRTFLFIQGMLEQKKVALSKLRELIFGKKTERSSPPKKPSKAPPTSPEPQNSNLPLAPSSSDSQPTPQAENTSEEEKELDQLHPPQSPGPDDSSGHGRRGSDSWESAIPIHHCHTCLQAGQVCPNCKKGKLYLYKKPAVLARIVGAAPLSIETHYCERLRCNLCGDLFTAPLPLEIQMTPVATAEANVIAAITKYQAATPFYRFATVLKGYGTPLPPTRLYSMAASVAGDALPVFAAFCNKAAQGELFQNDDTKVLIQSLLKENQEAEKSGKKLKRVGMFTTGIIAQVGEHRIFLYFSGRSHAGENLEKILKLRMQGLPPPTQVGDASTSNRPADFLVDLQKCLDHARREFYEIRLFHPKNCGFVLHQLGLVYRADKIAKKKKLTPEARLVLHQKVSLPVMQRLKAWGETEIQKKRIEPNSSLGKATAYFLNHYPELTLFTRKINVPLSNSACEQSLKTPIAIRKMAKYFKTVEGAQTASILLSLIQTTHYLGENIFEYLVAIQKHSSDAQKNPNLWFPWNFREQIKALVPKNAYQKEPLKKAA